MHSAYFKLVVDELVSSVRIFKDELSIWSERLYGKRLVYGDEGQRNPPTLSLLRDGSFRSSGTSKDAVIAGTQRMGAGRYILSHSDKHMLVELDYGDGDKRTWFFEMRDGVIWMNGRPCSVADLE